MALEALLSFQALKWIINNPLTLVKGFNECRRSINFVVGEEALRHALGTIRGGSWKRFSTLKLFLNLDEELANIIKG